jgi:mRNA interferase HigB
MNVIGLGKLYDFVRKHPDTRNWINNWISDAKASRWNTSQDIKKRYSSCSFLHANVVIFNVHGGKFRMEVLIAYQNGSASVSWIGTHAEYNRRCKTRHERKTH